MEPLELVERLAGVARREGPPAVPPVDVAALLRLCERERTQPLAFALPAAVSALAATVVVALSLMFGTPTAAASAASDPVPELFNPTQVELP